ncbi:hypothetical protein B0T16DRAFT_507766 [Cercophora newfieldiana]|uniref:Uncharacterized protein n=1 Tax=Cercophora newfieldiana TaxID=92897 RepID=A0AA40CS25_9PEZI|nr:hypothetical protein B0T16DRAFT_507766 [Cercophora newfieldiana]
MTVRAHKVVAKMTFGEIHDDLFGRKKSIGILPKVPTRQLLGIHLPRDHPFADRVLQSAHFLDNSAGAHISADMARRLHESCRSSGFRIPEDPRKMTLDHVVHRDLWDWAEEAFIPSVSDNPGWDAVVFYPAGRDGDVPTDVPASSSAAHKSDEEVTRLLNNASIIKMDDLMRDFPGIRNRIYNASGFRVRYLTKLERRDGTESPQNWHSWGNDWQRSGPDKVRQPLFETYHQKL